MTRVQKSNRNLEYRIQQIKRNQKYGDYYLLMILLNTPSQDAARQRFLRRELRAIEAMELIHDNRMKFIRDYHKRQELNKQ